MTKGWTHPICVPCWNKQNPTRLTQPMYLHWNPDTPCCFCGSEYTATTNSGVIYVRVDPESPTISCCKGHED